MSKSREITDATDDPRYQQLLQRISDTYVEGQRLAFQAVNEHLTATNWRIGRHIVEFEQGGKARAEYGTGLLQWLSQDLTLRHGKGFTRSGIIRIRQFYLTFPKGATASHLLSWSHFVCQIEKSCRENWSRRFVSLKHRFSRRISHEVRRVL
jgi:hypothetical protein